MNATGKQLRKELKSLLPQNNFSIRTRKTKSGSTVTIKVTGDYLDLLDQLEMETIIYRAFPDVKVRLNTELVDLDFPPEDMPKNAQWDTVIPFYSRRKVA